ncbi:MAG: amidase [Opitutus sp.]|nr:amidase [Opitutus sp.]
MGDDTNRTERARATSLKVCVITPNANRRAMTFREWQQLSPEDAAREVCARVQRALPAAQRRAAIALLASPEELVARFQAASRATPLGGVPFFAKDLFDFSGTPTLAGSTFLDRVRPAPKHDGALARALLQAGAVFVGKTHLHEFAYGTTGENPHHGDCDHPHFPGRTTGGSSSGSAAVVAADIVPFALGSDTGGSVRVPAAFCGLFGFRLTPGDAFIRDAFPLSATFDTAGWFTRNAADMRSALNALVTARTHSTAPRGCYLEYGALDDDVASACRTAAARITSPAESAERDSLLAGFAPALGAYHTIVALEAWQVHHTWAEQYREHYDPNVWQRLNRVHGITNAQGDAGRQEVQNVRAVWSRYFERHDFLVLPASPAPAPTKAECTAEMRNRVIEITAPASLGGLPALTVPVTLPSGLTTGLQIVAREPDSPVFDWVLAQY